MKKLIISMKIEADITEEARKEIDRQVKECGGEEILKEKITDEFLESLNDEIMDMFDEREFENIIRDIDIKFE